MVNVAKYYIGGDGNPPLSLGPWWTTLWIVEPNNKQNASTTNNPKYEIVNNQQTKTIINQQPKTNHTGDGSEIRRFHQLRLAIYPILYRVFDIPGG